MTMLIVKVQWMPCYVGEDIVRQPWGNYPGPFGERFNFLCRIDGNYYGYLKPAAGGGRVHLERVSDQISGGHIDGATVVFVAPQPGGLPRPLKVVGFYINAQVHEYAIDMSHSGETTSNIRLVTSKAYFIPEDDRSFEVKFDEMPRTSSYTWACPDLLRTDLMRYLEAFKGSEMAQDQKDNRPLQPELAREWVINTMAERIERRRSRDFREQMIAGPKSCVCECCGYKLTKNSHHALMRSFEVHHKNPIALLEVGEERSVLAQDLAIVCANCHRAIHSPGEIRYVSNLPAFKRDVLGLE